ncbi:MAG: polymer-forming cytoskeletal protein [bacterium]|nr:polymer-forming cytoskeletal protein [bacterium]
MSKSKKTVEKKPEALLSGLLGAGSRFEGRIRFEGVLRIDGVLHGEILCKPGLPSKVIITENAQVEANIVADEVIVSGSLCGNIKAVERLELLNPGRIEGLIYSSDFSIEDGALFQGECIMIRGWSEEDKQAFKLEGFYEIHQQNSIYEEAPSR